MMIFGCCSGLIGRKKERKVEKESLRSADFNKGLKTLKIRLEQPVKPFESDELKTTSFRVSVPVGVVEDSLDVKVTSHGTRVGDEAAEVAYEGEDEHEDSASMKRDLSDFDLSRRGANSGEEQCTPKSGELGFFDSSNTDANGRFLASGDKDIENEVDMVQGGHLSDPGMGKANFWGSPKLKRSCSNLETGRVERRMAKMLPPLASLYSGDSEELPKRLEKTGSPASMTSHQSADRVMLKKHSSSQVLPSRSRRLWWKLFLWSHRNLHKPCTEKPKPHAVSTIMKQQGGYSSDTLELNQAMTSSKMQSPGSFTGESLNLGHHVDQGNNQDWCDFQGRIAGMWQNQWVAFSVESSPFARVDEWVRDLETQPPPLDDFDDDGHNRGKAILYPSSPETCRSPTKSMANVGRRLDINLSEEILHANSMIQSLNSSSTVAHISGIGLRAVPTISCFSSLRSVNLSNNLIAYIAPGSLPKGLHILNLSRNKINAIEGLRELTRLRLLDLSYNRISRIGQGLSNCTMIKELHLAGNKISDVEGLHRLLKLTVLDLSFNKITTKKALGQLVGNYNTLQALNLLGNPILSNISEDQLRKAVYSLLPKLVYLNKQPIKPQRAREFVTDSVAKAALGSGSSWGSRRRAGKKVSSSVLAPSVRRSSTASTRKSKDGLKSRSHHLKTVSYAQASSSR